MSRLAKVFDVLQPADYTISTWLLLGAAVQCMLVSMLPRNVALLPSFLLLFYRLANGYLVATGWLPNPALKEAYHGRRTWQIPSANDTAALDSSSESIVVLVLAATWHHPNGRFSPGSVNLGNYFTKMWRDAEANREKYGFLGNTPSLTAEDFGEARPDSQGRTMVYLSYWKSLEGLRQFAHAEAHMKGQMWWERGANDKFPHIGLMHETYEVPAGNWENVFLNFRPFGISNAKYPVRNDPSDETVDKEQSPVVWASGLQSADRKQWKTMLSRMGRRV